MMSLPQLETSNPEARPTTSIQTFPGYFASLEKIARFVCAASQSAGFDSRSIYAIETAIDEACSNIIEHAYGGEGRGEIDVTCVIHPDKIQFILHDTGEPFNLDNVPEPDFSTNLEDRPAHGLGIYMMRQWMDEVRFEFVAGKGNYCILVKRKPG